MTPTIQALREALKPFARVFVVSKNGGLQFSEGENGRLLTLDDFKKAAEVMALPIKSEAERTNEALLNRIEDAIRSYKLSFTEPEDETGSFHIVDALTPPGDDNIKRGEEELDLLVDAVLAEVEEALDAKDAEKAVVQEELKTERRHWIEDDRDLNELIAKNEALTSKLKIAEKALVKLGRFKLGSFGDMFLNDIIDSALKSIRGDEEIK